MIYYDSLENYQSEGRPACVTIGKFDGLHLGHQRLIDCVKAYERQGCVSIMLCLNMKADAISGREYPQPIYSAEERIKLLESRGPQVLIDYDFTWESAQLEAKTFLEDCLVGRLGAKYIVVGDDFCFGKDRRGNIDYLKSEEQRLGYSTIVCTKVESEGRVVSSSCIRKFIREGDTDLAAKMLNRGYFEAN